MKRGKEMASRKKIGKFWRGLLRACAGRENCQTGKPLYREVVKINWRDR